MPSRTLIFANSFNLPNPRGGQIDLCLNYVQGGSCLIDRKPCLLGTRGNEARNEELECRRQGPFDVWRTQDGLILISDLGSPREGAVDCYGLGISLEEAAKVAQNQSQALRTKIVTTERKCRKCGTRFWPRAKSTDRSPPGRAAGYFCASCLQEATDEQLEEYWKEIGTAQDTSHIDLSDWCG